jgi:exosortase
MTSVGSENQNLLGMPRDLAVALGCLLALFVALNYSAIGLLVDRWSSDDNYGHGFLIPFISLYFVWTKKEELAKLTPTPAKTGLAIFLFGLLLRFFVPPLESAVLSGISIVIMTSGLLLYLGGWKVYRVLWLPALYLAFMVPLPEAVHAQFALPLQKFASGVSAFLLERVFNVPVLYSWGSNVIELANHKLQVAEACSGMRSILGLLALGVAFAYFWERPLWMRIWLIVSTVPIAIVANICRVTVTGILYDREYVTLAQGFYHEFTGWFVFIFAMTLLMLEAWLLSRLFHYTQTDAKSTGEPAAEGDVRS